VFAAHVRLLVRLPVVIVIIVIAIALAIVNVIVIVNVNVQKIIMVAVFANVIVHNHKIV
jgi:hypothetical protein